MLIAPLNAFPWVVNGLMEAWISVARLNVFLTLKDMDFKEYYHFPHSMGPGVYLFHCLCSTFHPSAFYTLGKWFLTFLLLGVILPYFTTPLALKCSFSF